MKKMGSQLVERRTLGAAADRQAFERSVRDSHDRAHAMAYWLAGNRNDAEDLLQETYLRAFRFWHRYDPNQPFTGWLCRIMSNVHIDMVRRNGRLRTCSMEGEHGLAYDPADTALNAEEAMARSELNENLVEGLRSMKPEFRAAVVLADVEGMAYEEIAEAMNTSVGTVRSRIHRGRKHLRKFFMGTEGAK
jgi:RNA polymerase sigma-70 factor (ECF subfamily)